MDNYDKYKTQEAPAMSAEELDEMMEADEAAKLEDLCQVAEEFCDYINRETYFGGWSAEVCEGKVLIVSAGDTTNPGAGDEATHEFEVIKGMYMIGRGARSLNWFSEALTGYMADWIKARAEMQAKKAAMKGGAK